MELERSSSTSKLLTLPMEILEKILLDSTDTLSVRPDFCSFYPLEDNYALIYGTPEERALTCHCRRDEQLKTSRLATYLYSHHDAMSGKGTRPREDSLLSATRLVCRSLKLLVDRVLEERVSICLRWDGIFKSLLKPSPTHTCGSLTRQNRNTIDNGHCYPETPLYLELKNNTLSSLASFLAKFRCIKIIMHEHVISDMPKLEDFQACTQFLLGHKISRLAFEFVVCHLAPEYMRDNLGMIPLKDLPRTEREGGLPQYLRESYDIIRKVDLRKSEQSPLRRGSRDVFKKTFWKAEFVQKENFSFPIKGDFIGPIRFVPPQKRRRQKYYF